MSSRRRCLTLLPQLILDGGVAIVGVWDRLLDLFRLGLVDILPALRDELTSHRHAAASARPADLVFPTSSGSRRDKDNARERVIRPVVASADELLARRGHAPLPEGVTAHKLRHTFASILYVRGEDPAYVMAQLGHTDPGFTPPRLRPRDAPRPRRQGMPPGARRGP